MIVVKEVIESVAMETIRNRTITPTAAGDLKAVGRHGRKVIPGAISRSGAKRGPVVTGNVFAIGQLGQKDRARIVLHRGDFIARRIPDRR